MEPEFKIIEPVTWEIIRTPQEERLYKFSCLYDLWRKTEPLAPLRATYWDEYVEAREAAFPRASYELY